MAGDEFQGMAVPAGDPDGVAQAARGFSAVAAGTAVAATRLEAMPNMVGSWIGGASVGHASMCLSNAGAARQAGEAATIIVRASDRYSEELRDARRDARHAIRDARDAQHRIDKAKDDIADAQGRLADANRRIDSASHILAISSVGGTPSPAAEADLAAASDDAERAADDERRARRELKRAEDDLDDAKRRWHTADQAAKDAARIAAAAFSQAAAMLPGWVTPPPPAAKPEPKDDRHWWQKAADYAWDQTKGLGTGAWEGVKGLGGAAAMGYRASPFNAVVDPDSFARQWSQLGQGAMYAYHHPGDFAKMAVNYDDLSHGRIGEWLGNLAPDAALAFGTAGVGTVASRSARVAKVIEKGADSQHGAQDRRPQPDQRPLRRQEVPALAGAERPVPEGRDVPRDRLPRLHAVPRGARRDHRPDRDVRIDGRLANQANSVPRTPEGWTWHHVEDGRTMELVPRDLHEISPPHRRRGGDPPRSGRRDPDREGAATVVVGTGAAAGAGSDLFGQAPAMAGAGP